MAASINFGLSTKYIYLEVQQTTILCSTKYTTPPGFDTSLCSGLQHLLDWNNHAIVTRAFKRVPVNLTARPSRDCRASLFASIPYHPQPTEL